jgi:hypothetical protein
MFVGILVVITSTSDRPFGLSDAAWTESEGYTTAGREWEA